MGTDPAVRAENDRLRQENDALRERVRELENQASEFSQLVAPLPSHSLISLTKANPPPPISLPSFVSDPIVSRNLMAHHSKPHSFATQFSNE